MAFSESFLDELTARNDIVSVVSEYVQLTKRSGSNMFGLCPFHSEKTPSFSVSQDKQIYHCFGCGKGGGVISFIMEIENLSFTDAVHLLAKRAGMTVPDDDTPAALKERRSRLLELSKSAARFYYNLLSTPKGSTAVEYINRRGISKEMVRHFGLGAAPNEWNCLSDAMMAEGWTADELLESGLAKKGRRGGLYDTFRNRLMFPVIDVRGSVIGFSGRILDDVEPKYLNSPDTMIFNKSRNLFALNLAKKSRQNRLILVEGNIDVVSLHQAGFDCAVASLGTSLTPDQARLMTRYTQEVVIAYDSDTAGEKAAKRAIGILENVGLNVKVLKMDGAKDPDEYIKKKGADAFSLLLDKSENHIDYLLGSVSSKYVLDTEDGRIAFFREAAELLSDIGNAVEREVYSDRVAQLAGVSRDAVKLEVNKIRRRRAEAMRKKTERNETRPTLNLQPSDRAIRYENPASAVAEEGVIKLLMSEPELINSCGALSGEDFTSEFLGKTYDYIKEELKKGRSPSLAALTGLLDAPAISRLTEIIQRPEVPGRREQALTDYIEKIRAEKLRKTDKEDLLTIMSKYRQTKGFGG
ncbi:MAG: DNA primase [Oscillospiraceae bacterium]|nr:DNA primase [Oscillospiraceae bacterium]